MARLRVRAPAFRVDASVPFQWQPVNPRFGLFANAFTFLAIAFERYIVAATRQAMPRLTDPTVAEEADAFRTEVASLPKVPVSAADLSSVYRFADGTLSPLKGPMDRETYDRVLAESIVVHNGKKYAWTIPLAFPVASDVAKTLGKGQKVALTTPSGDAVASLAAIEMGNGGPKPPEGTQPPLDGIDDGGAAEPAPAKGKKQAPARKPTPIRGRATKPAPKKPRK